MRGTTVLRNLAGLDDEEQLAELEAGYVTLRSQERLPSGRLSVSHYLTIHRHLFQDIYDWAGRPRTVRIFKGGNAFCYPENIHRELKGLFGRLREREHFRGLESAAFVREAAAFISHLNAIHPFREGNGRSQNIFLAVLAERAGHSLHFERMDPDAFLHAMVLSFSGQLDELERQIAGMIA